MKAKLCNAAIIVGAFILSACSVTQDQLKQEHDLVSALREVNKADREVSRQEQAVKLSGASLAAANVALVKAKQDQQKARDNFNNMYSASQVTPEPSPQPAQ
ncbi:MAG: hypothetical protein ACK5JN_03010 [Kluyvera sp.]|uniref:hypothetical protein n=1 Tax=Kluyvera sp. TaxID=1538228 RepID=UPI003A883D9E